MKMLKSQLQSASQKKITPDRQIRQFHGFSSEKLQLAQSLSLMPGMNQTRSLLMKIAQTRARALAPRGKSLLRRHWKLVLMISIVSIFAILAWFYANQATQAILIAEKKVADANQARQNAENQAAAADAARQIAESRQKTHNKKRIEAEREAADAIKAKEAVENRAAFFGRWF
jgi:hypothetical protein